MIHETAIRELARRSDGAAVTSMYLDVDGRRYPRPSDWGPHADHLFRVARERAEQHGPAARQVVADIARIGEWLGAELDRTTARGVAVFSCGADDLFEAFQLPVAVHDQVVIGPAPDVAQLAAIVSTAGETLVVAVDRQRSRFVRVRLGEVAERNGPFDEVERQADTDIEMGSWDRRHEEQAREHSRHVARAVAAELDARPAAHVVLAGTEETTASLKQFLPPRVTSLIRGRVAVPMSASRAEVAAAGRDVVEETERRRQLEELADLRDRASHGAGAVTGLPSVLEVLAGGNATALFVEDGFGAAGGRCTACGALAVDSSPCPRCGEGTAWLENVVDAAVSEAFARHVQLRFCHPDDLGDLGRIGATVRR